MKRFWKITGIVLSVLIVSFTGLGVYLYHTPTIQAIVHFDETKLFYSPSKDVEEIRDVAYEERVLTVDDTVSIYTYYFQTVLVPPKAKLFFIHGNAENVSKFQGYIKSFLAGGYNVYAVDFRGYGKSTGVPTYQGVWKDVDAAFVDFQTLTQDDRLKTVVFGMSLGGQLAVKTVHDHPSEVDAMVLDGSISSAMNIALDRVSNAYLKKKVREMPEMFNQEYVAERDIQSIQNIPKLIIHSEDDEVVPFHNGQLLYDQAQQPKTFWVTHTGHIKTLAVMPEAVVDEINNLVGE
jgi:alpha-beta hydrolase superfamily lysophospholipase